MIRRTKLKLVLRPINKGYKVVTVYVKRNHDKIGVKRANDKHKRKV